MAQTPFSTPPAAADGISRAVLLGATAAVLLIVALVAWATLRRPATDAHADLPPDSYAANLHVGNVHLSEATNGAGGTVTYVDGTLTNAGPRTLTAATVQLGFAPGDGGAPQRQLAPLTLIRTREPYVDLEPLSAEPLGPGSTHDFRLIVESVPAGWDEKPPSIRVTHTAVR